MRHFRWWCLLLAGCLTVAACSSGAPQAPGPSPAAAGRWPVEIDSSAVGMSLGRHGLIVVTPGFNKFPPQAYRFGVAGVRDARQSVAGSPNAMALAPDGGVWIAATSHPDMASGTGVQILDPVSLRVRREIGFPAKPLTVAFVGTDAWVGTAAGIDVLDSRTFARKRSLPFGAQVLALTPVPASGAVIVIQEGKVTSVDAGTGRTLVRLPVAAIGSISAVLAGDALWLGWPVDGATIVRRADPRTLRLGAAGPRLSFKGAALAGTAGALWVADHDGRLLCLDPTSGAVRTDRDVPSEAAVAADDRYVFVGASHQVDRVDATC